MPSRQASHRSQSSRTVNNGSRPESDAVGMEPTEQEIHQKPWKYIGYRGYAAFIASDDDFFILRRFDALNARVALMLQDEISDLQEELDIVDKRYSDRNAEDLHNGTFRGDQEDRSVIVQTLAKKLRRYNEFILQQSSLRRLPQAPHRDVKSIRNWHFNHDYQAIAREEQMYLDHDGDLVCVTPKDEKTPLRRLLDSSLRLRTLVFWRHKEEDIPSYDAEEVAYYSDKRINRFLSGIITVIGVAMLITPIWTLQAIEGLQMKLVVITVFIFVFLIALSFAMVTKPFEALGATAAYAAVLMVFLQLGRSDS